jgi:hypothetical protein
MRLTFTKEHEGLVGARQLVSEFKALLFRALEEQQLIEALLELLLKLLTLFQPLRRLDPSVFQLNREHVNLRVSQVRMVVVRTAVRCRTMGVSSLSMGVRTGQTSRLPWPLGRRPIVVSGACRFFRGDTGCDERVVAGRSGVLARQALILGHATNAWSLLFSQGRPTIFNGVASYIIYIIFVSLIDCIFKYL